MTLIAAVAKGDTAVADLRRHMNALPPEASPMWVEHEGKAVAWNSANRWVSSYDDGEVLAVVDGQLHSLVESGRCPAQSVHARYRRVGSQVARDLLGDFVVIILDRRRDLLLVARDPLGVRPWYLAGNPERCAGATNLSTLYPLPWVDRTPDEVEALLFLSGYSYSRGPTLVRGIRTLRPGVTWESSGTNCIEAPHHTWCIQDDVRLSWDDAVERCREALDEAVRSRIRAAGEATAELSGGLDSSAVVGTAMLMGHRATLAGRLVFDDAGADERSFSDAVIKHWEVECVSVAPWIPAEAELVAWTAALTRPVPDPNFAMVASLQREFSRRGRRIAMTGLGGDDAFIYRSRKSRVASAIRHRQLEILASVLREDLRHPRSAWRGTWRGVLGYHVPWRPRLAPPSPLARSAVAAGVVTRLLARPIERVAGDRAVDERCHGLTSGFRASVFEESALVDDLTGVRSTHPFLDPRFISATYGLNPWFPLRDGHDRALEVAAYSDRIPGTVLERRDKAEFSGILRSALGQTTMQSSDALLTGPLVDLCWVDAGELHELLRQASSGLPGTVKRVARARAMDMWLRSL